MKVINRATHKIDASGQIAGRLASLVAGLLIGKNKPSYEPNIDGGDFVIVNNFDKVVFTGKKLTDKFYYKASGHPGGLKTTSLEKRLKADQEKLFKDMVRLMLPKNKLSTARLKRLTVK